MSIESSLLRCRSQSGTLSHVASIISHVAVPLALGIGLGTPVVPGRLLAAGALASIVPDLDVVAFRFDIPYDSAWAHRGFTHSLGFALVLGGCAAAGARWLHARRWLAFLFVALAAASHGLLDAFTTGGRGIMFFWPLEEERFFFPWRVILVSPIGLRRFLSDHGLAVLANELVWVWLPSLALALVVYAVRRLVATAREN